MINFNDNILHLKQSDIRRMSIECNKHPEGINLSQGICDLDLPDQLVNGVTDAIKDGYNIYTRYDGIDELRRAISDKMTSFNNVAYDADSEIVITSGSSAAFFLFLFSIKQQQDEIIMFQPFYGYHYNTILSLGMKPVVLDMDPENDWAIDYDLVERSITDRTRAIIINTPSNPAGKIFSEEEIKKIGAIARKHDIFIITDEIYEYITYDGAKHISPASVDGLKDITVTIGGLSKTFSITGWRIGYICAPAEIIQKIGVLNDLFYICAPAPLQKAVAGALKMDASFFTGLAGFYQKNRDLIVDTLENIGFKVYLPRGSYYLLADFSKLGFSDCREAADTILQNTGVATVPGASFFENGNKNGNMLLRFCFAKKYDILKKACDNLKKIV